MTLTEPILSRFDILCVVKDEVDFTRDGHMAKFVVLSHKRHHPAYKNRRARCELYKDPAEKDVAPIPQEILKKYIVYARQNIHPRLQNVDQDKIAKMYSQLRHESSVSCN